MYSPLRDVVNAAAYSKAFDGLAKTTEVGMEEEGWKGRRKQLGREGERDLSTEEGGVEEMRRGEREE